MTTTLEAIRKYQLQESLAGLRGLACGVTSGPSPLRIVSKRIQVNGPLPKYAPKLCSYYRYISARN
jgi:hypothetical protein